MVCFFFVGGLHILDKEQLLDTQDLKSKLIDYIYSLQLSNGGFVSSTLYSKLGEHSKYGQGHIVFTYSALNSLSILGALHKIDKELVLR